jgi:hypothetical protein
MNLLPPTLAAAIAVVISFTELLATQRKRLPWAAWTWVTLRLTIEGTTAAVAYALMDLLFDGLQWFHGALPIIVSGLAGPALLRAQLALLGSGQESSYYGPAVAYRRFQKRVDDAIDDVSSATHAEWVYARAMPFINELSLDTIVNQGLEYFRSLERLKQEERDEITQLLRNLLLDNSPTQTRKATAVNLILSKNGRRMVDRLVRQGRQERRVRLRRPSAGPASGGTIQPP